MEIVFKLSEHVMRYTQGYPVVMMYSPPILDDTLINFIKLFLPKLHNFIIRSNGRRATPEGRYGYLPLFEGEKEVLVNFFKTLGCEVEDHTNDECGKIC